MGSWLQPFGPCHFHPRFPHREAIVTYVNGEIVRGGSARFRALPVVGHPYPLLQPLRRSHCRDTTNRKGVFAWTRLCSSSHKPTTDNCCESFFLLTYTDACAGWQQRYMHTHG